MTRHTPMTALYDGEGHKRALVGYQCGHCGSLFTPACTPSEAHVQLEPVPGAKRITRPNKAHKRRVRAAR